jgi:hypothetical protein
VQTNDGRLSNARVPIAGSANYVQNTTTQEVANFNISGTGIIGGNLGIGTSTPSSKLGIVGAQDALSMTGFQPFLTLQDSNSANKRSRIQGAQGDINLFTESYLNGSNLFSYLHLDSATGNVGIGSSAPVAKLEVVGQDAVRLIGSQPFLTLFDSTAGYARSRIQGAKGDVNLFTESYLNGSNPFSYLHLDSATGNVGIGSSTPVAKLEVVGQDALRLIGYQPFLTLFDSNTGYARGRIQTAGGAITFFTESYLNNSNINNYAQLTANGNFTVKSITIRGGADLAEPFQMQEEELGAGSVVVIDDKHPGWLKRSTTAYDKRVAGIVSGANGINPGISLHQEGAVEGGQNVALTGRVYVQADASSGPIEPGDMLTTSDTPGYAMKVSDPARAQGAVIGKAMSPLPEGTGMVLVLVSLQ